MPAPCDERSQLVERERRLVLDVLDAHALRAPRGTRRTCSRRRRPTRPRYRAPAPRRVLVGRVDEHREVVEQRTLRRRRARLRETRRSAPPTSTRARAGAPRTRTARTPRPSPRDRASRSATWSRSYSTSVGASTSVIRSPSPARTLAGVAVRELRRRRAEVGHAEPDVRECPLLARPFRVEEASACRAARRRRSA